MNACSIAHKALCSQEPQRGGESRSGCSYPDMDDRSKALLPGVSLITLQLCSHCHNPEHLLGVSLLSPELFCSPGATQSALTALPGARGAHLLHHVLVGLNGLLLAEHLVQLAGEEPSAARGQDEMREGQCL